MEESPERFFGGFAPALESWGWADAVVDLAGCHQVCDIAGGHLGVQIFGTFAAAEAQFHRGNGAQELGQQAVDFGPYGVGGVAALRNFAHGHDTTGIDSMKLHVEPGSGTQAIVGDHGGGARDDSAQFGVRGGFAARQLEDVAGAQLAQACLHLRDTLEHERVEAVAGRGVGAGEALEADQRQLHAIGHLRRVQQGVIGCYAAIPTAPVQDVPAARPDGLLIERSYAFVHRGHGHGYWIPVCHQQLQ